MNKVGTPDQDQDTGAALARFDWAALGLAFGGVLTVVWIGLVLWAAFRILLWACN